MNIRFHFLNAGGGTEHGSILKFYIKYFYLQNHERNQEWHWISGLQSILTCTAYVSHAHGEKKAFVKNLFTCEPVNSGNNDRLHASCKQVLN